MKFFSWLSGFSRKNQYEYIARILDELKDTTHDVDSADLEKIAKWYVPDMRNFIRGKYQSGNDLSALVRSNQSGILGTGINIQFLSDDKKLNATVEKAIKKHNMPKNFSVSGLETLNTTIEGMVRMILLEGGFILVHHYNADWEIPYRSELVSVDEIDINKSNENTENGIEKDSYGRVTGLWIKQKQGESKKVDAKDCIYYIERWVGAKQYTAIPLVLPAVVAASYLNSYTSDEVKAAKERAKNTSFWETSLYSTVLNIVKQTSALVDGKTDSIESSRAELMGKIIKASRSSDGGILALPLGDKVHFNPHSPESVFEVMEHSMRTAIASSLGYSSAIIYKDLKNVNYSAFKGATADAESLWAYNWTKLLDFVIEPLYKEKILPALIMAGKISKDYYADSDFYEKIKFMRVVNRTLDPAKDATAMKTEMESGVVSPAEIAFRQGRNIDDVTDEIVRYEVELALKRKQAYEKAGLELPDSDKETKTIREDLSKTKEAVDAQNELLQNFLRTKIENV